MGETVARFQRYMRSPCTKTFLWVTTAIGYGGLALAMLIFGARP